MKRAFFCFFLVLLFLFSVFPAVRADFVIRISPPASTPEPKDEAAPVSVPAPEPTEDPWPFVIRYGSRDENKISLSMDDCYDIEWVAETLKICQEYNIVMTFYPLGICLKEEDRDVWQAVIDAGCEIGTHTMRHSTINKGEAKVLLSQLLKPQEQLDRVLGYHYPIRTLRPPYGTVEDSQGRVTTALNALKRAGFNHVVNWDVSQTDPVKAAPAVRNGSILLYHARKKDVDCIRQLVPVLLEKGFEFVTIAELIGLDPEVTTSPELFVYDSANYFP